jgi:hypothetical protein
MKLLIAFALAVTTLSGCVVVPWGDGYNERHYYRGDRYHGDGYYRDGYYREGYRDHG